MLGRRRFAFFTVALYCSLAANPVAAETAFVPPPRTISDIREILEQQKPDPDAIARLKDEASMEVPAAGDPARLAQLHFDRAQARAGLGRTSEAAADAKAAIAHQRRAGGETFAMEHFLFAELSYDPAAALPILAEMRAPYAETDGGTDAITVTRLLANYKYTLLQLVALGDFGQAETILKKSQALFDLAVSRNLHGADLYRSAWEGELEFARGYYLEARGDHRAAESAFMKSEAGDRDAMIKSAQWPHRPPRETFAFYVDTCIQAVGRTKAAQGRIAEGEADVRRALLNRLRSVGKYHITTANFLFVLARVMAAQGRFDEAEILARSAAEILVTLGVAKDSRFNLRILALIAATLNFQARWADAAAAFKVIDDALASAPPQRRLGFANRFRIRTMYHSGETEAGVALARRVVAFERIRVGERHFDYARATGILAEGLARLGRDAEALAAFRPSIPILTADTPGDEDDSRTGPSGRDQLLRRIIEPYIDLMARSSATDEAAAATFGLADTIRARSVQNAIAASSARAVAGNPALAELVRSEQDLRKRFVAHFVMLNDLFGQPPSRRDERVVAELQAAIARLRADHAKVRQDIERKFPDYADLLAPKPAGIEDVRQVLHADEALLSFYFGEEHSFVWAVSKTGPAAFAAIKASPAEIAGKVNALRAALEPNATTIADIPRFDVAQAYSLYALLLKPVEPAWKPAKTLIVVTNGALATLPIAVLPTAPVEGDYAANPDFSGYRAVPWLARTHAVTSIPSVAALRTLRRLPPAPAGRAAFIGFGDPFFNMEQAAHAEREFPKDVAAATRGLPLRRRAAPQTRSVDSAELALLPRLPDTADELRSVALALNADPAKALFLGKAANEARVKAADLARYRVVAFATHGLVPGDLNGLTQPALALTAPNVAGVDGDGLLTMDEILALKLDADWVVLSACNTASGAEAGAEAASGLGRAFFYAGTRVILVTNWSVHSASARELVTDLFRRQAADPPITRAEALRQAMLALLDTGGFADDSGKPLFTYAHPLFWAPYTIIGDGSAR